MFKPTDAPALPRILYSCYANRSRAGEQFVPEHIFSYQLAGTLVLTDGQQRHTFGEGSVRLLRRNQLVKFQKHPPAEGDFETLSVFFDQPTLWAVRQEYGYRAAAHVPGPGILPVAPSLLYTSYFESLRPYQQLAQPGQAPLLALKVQEALLLLLQTNPALQQVLFDFSEPGKIDLEAFMHANFRFNVALSRFAYLTGRSLATFKRDFEKLFGTSPSRWLQQRRLQEAHYLLREGGRAPSEVYTEVGFENLSHFSFAFKQAYGVAPSRVS